MIHWNVDPVLFSLGFISPRWYGVLFALAFVFSYYIMRGIFRKEKKPIEDLDLLTIYMIIGTIAGARLGHMLYEPEIFLQNPLNVFAIWNGGLASHGGAAGIMFCAFLFRRKRPQYTWIWLLDRLTIVAAISGMCIRIGNLFNSEILGLPTNVPWGVVFELDKTEPRMVPRHPAQVYEALICLALFFVMRWMYNRGAATNHPGRMIGVFLILLFTARFFVEFLKERQVAFEAGMALDMGQLLSLPFIALGVWFLLYRSPQTRQPKPAH